MKTILNIKGMMCGMCESHVNDAIRNNFTVKKVKSSRRKEQTVIVSNEALDKDKLASVIKEIGYDLVSISEES
ncbi:MAG: heavy-metal-associated domain-containing protein [Treponemataceae bacterium]|nr:heavy-metal-associated domain-containing protein [Treponemataceae bacterium]